MGGAGIVHSHKRHRKESSWVNWCCVLIVFLLIVAAVIVVLALTVFRVRDPRITVNNINLDSFSLTFPPGGPQLSFTLALNVSIVNRNKASFKYYTSTAYLYYHGSAIGTAPIPAGKVKADGTSTLATTVTVDANTLVGNPYLSGDIQTGVLPLVSTTVLRGKIYVFNIVKHHATSTANCVINVNVLSATVRDFSCSYRLRL